jgi:hypothetical protein
MSDAYAGWLTQDDLQALLIAPPAAFNWMILEAVDEVKPPGVYQSDIDLTRFEAGRAFGAACDLRWQRDGQYFHTLLVGDVALPSSPLAENHRELDAANFEQTEREYYLWGEWSGQLPEWVEATIPHIFNYPPPPGAGRWRRKIITVEYVNRTTGEMEFYRFAGVREESL